MGNYQRLLDPKFEIELQQFIEDASIVKQLHDDMQQIGTVALSRVTVEQVMESKGE